MPTMLRQVKVIIPRKTQDAGWKTGKLWQKTETGNYAGESRANITYYFNHPFGKGFKV